MVILVLSIISLITTLIGLWLLGEKKSLGFVVFTGSLACQLYIFAVQKNWFLVFQMLVLIVFNLVNYRKWEKGANE